MIKETKKKIAAVLVKLLSLFSRYHFIHLYIQFSIVFRSRKKIFFWFTIFFLYFEYFCVPHSEGKNALNESITLGEKENQATEKKDEKLQNDERLNECSKVFAFVRDDDIKNISYDFTRSKCRFFFICNTQERSWMLNWTAYGTYSCEYLHTHHLSIPHCNAACIHVELIIIIIKFPHL